MEALEKHDERTRVATVSAKGWVVIPAPLRRRYRIEPGQKVRIVDYGNVLSLVPEMKDPIREARGFLAGDGKPLTEMLLEERARERKREL